MGWLARFAPRGSSCQNVDGECMAISYQMLIWPHRVIRGVPGVRSKRGASSAVEHGFTLCSTDGDCETRFAPGLILLRNLASFCQKPSKLSNERLKYRCGRTNHDRRRSAVQLKTTAVLLLRESTMCSNILSLTSPLAIPLTNHIKGFFPNFVRINCNFELFD